MDFLRKIVVFFSWQSDIPRNHSLIKSGLEKACKKLSNQLGCQVVYDESMRGEPGSPRTLVDFMNRMASYDFVKTILTCRSEYFTENFADLKINLGNELLLENNIYQHIQVDNQNQLLENYF